MSWRLESSLEVIAQGGGGAAPRWCGAGRALHCVLALAAAELVVVASRREVASWRSDYGAEMTAAARTQESCLHLWPHRACVFTG